MTPARILFLLALLDAAIVGPHLRYEAIVALLAIVGALGWLLGRWHERDTAVVHEVSQDLYSVLRRRK